MICFRWASIPLTPRLREPHEEEVVGWQGWSGGYKPELKQSFMEEGYQRLKKQTNHKTLKLNRFTKPRPPGLSTHEGLLGKDYPTHCAEELAPKAGWALKDAAALELSLLT